MFCCVLPIALPTQYPEKIWHAISVATLFYYSYFFSACQFLPKNKLFFRFVCKLWGQPFLTVNFPRSKSVSRRYTSRFVLQAQDMQLTATTRYMLLQLQLRMRKWYSPRLDTVCRQRVTKSKKTKWRPCHLCCMGFHFRNAKTCKISLRFGLRIRQDMAWNTPISSR